MVKECKRLRWKVPVSIIYEMPNLLNKRPFYLGCDGMREISDVLSADKAAVSSVINPSYCSRVIDMVKSGQLR